MYKWIILINRSSKEDGCYFKDKHVFTGYKKDMDKITWEMFMQGIYERIELVRVI